MDPFLFSSGEHELLGMYHPPEGISADRSLLICPPVLTDYSRSYGALRVLADNAAARGYHVLRFDYAGTGDSGGDFEQAGPSTWMADIVAAANELEEISGAPKPALLGVRLGGLLAMNAAEHVSASSLVLWDPVCDTAVYLDILASLQSSLTDLHVNLAPGAKQRAKAELCGYARPTWVDSALAELRRPAEICSFVGEIKLVASQEYGGRDSQQRDLQSLDCVTQTDVALDCRWESDAESIMTPNAATEACLGCL